MPNAAEELMGSCDTASHGAIGLRGRAALRGADPGDKTCNACNAACNATRHGNGTENGTETAWEQVGMVGRLEATISQLSVILHTV